jgi:predicted Zn-dependent protease
VAFEPRLPPENNVTPIHPLAELATLLGGIALATLLLTGVAALAVDLAVRFIPASAEVRLFGNLWDDVEASVDDPRLPACRDLMQRLAGRWSESPGNLRLGVMEGEEPNAFALPGGAIFVTRGLLDQVESENELAFVIAHELGHFQGRDHLRAVGRAVLLGLTLATLTGSGGGETLPMIVSTLTQLGFAREQEEHADEFALHLVQLEYGHVDGALSFFDRLPDAGADDVGDRLGSYLATHPLTHDRREALESLAASQGWREQGTLEPLAASFASP